MTAVVLRFGNCNNGSNAGLACSNLNNSAANANWNISASVNYLTNTVQNVHIYPTPQTVESTVISAQIEDR